jgi:hypothetical protein
VRGRILAPQVAKFARSIPGSCERRRFRQFVGVLAPTVLREGSMTNGLQERWGRETRLLVLIVVVSVAVLLVLARFRFPAATLEIAPPTPSPLANLARRAPFEELSEAVAGTAGRISPRVLVVRLRPVQPSPPARGGRGTAEPHQDVTRLAIGLRVRPDVAVVRVPSGMMPVELVESSQAVEIVGADSKRELAAIRVPAGADPALEAAADPFAGFAFVGEATPTSGGPSVHPVFIGRIGVRQHEQWPAALTSVDSADVTDGSVLFTIDGRLIGMVLRDSDGAALITPPVMEVAVGALLAPPGGAS